MTNFPDSHKKLTSRISSYKSALTKEKRERGCIRDGSGKRYLLFSLLFVLNNLEKSKQYFEWFKNEFPEDRGEPLQKLCWAISLHRLGNENEAKTKLAELMLSNLYVIPFVLNHELKKYDMWHSSNWEEMDYVHYIPGQVLDGITSQEIKWIESLYNSFEFRRIRKRYIQIYHDLQHTKELNERTELLDEAYSLLKMLCIKS